MFIYNSGSIKAQCITAKMCEQEMEADMEDIVAPREKIENMGKLREIVQIMVNSNINSKKEMTKFINDMKKEYKMEIKRINLLYAYRIMSRQKIFKYEKKYANFLQLKSVRSDSGVFVFGMVTSPYPDGQSFSCPEQCKFCPEQIGYPKSYVPGEPGVDRAFQNDYDPLRQFRDRANTYFVNGSDDIDKAEVVILGGTWHSYPEKYRIEFIRQIYYAANTYYDSSDITKLRPPLSLEEEMIINETAACHVIGITIETRPDYITPREIVKLRKLGVTRIQMGVQHIDDRILERVNRGCTLRDTVRALKLLKDSCFKVDIHIMPDMPKPLKIGVDPYKFIEHDDIDWDFDMVAADIEMFRELVYNPDLRADQKKIYPFQVVEYSQMKEEYERGLHIPYSTEIATAPLIVGEGGTPSITPLTKLDEVLMYALSIMPEEVRVNRVLRDNPKSSIVAGANDLNKYQLIMNEMAKRKLTCMDIRNSEVKDKDVDRKSAVFSVKVYEASEGMEYFLQFRSPDRKILFGFLRLRLGCNSGMHGDNVIFNELVGAALIRELHVYGKVAAVRSAGQDDGAKVQHVGFGKRLMFEAFRIARENGYEKIAVISGNGVKEYYRKMGFVDEGLYLTKDLTKDVTRNLSRGDALVCFIEIVIAIIFTIIYFMVKKMYF